MATEKTNSEGMTFKEWLYAAVPGRARWLFEEQFVQPEMTSNLGIYYGVREEFNAWLRGEDPAEWRAEQGAP